MKRRDLVRLVTEAGCRLVREGANHSLWINPATDSVSTIPRHREINELLARKILRDLGVPTPD
ncbi:MAG: type II toxin-antitoxin system HicA family toxin [Gemmatimonadetes bacterium]|nr:type II toxin-antitoxin system HicA family toxin [Gemmatimonadota bacterium]MBK9549711.1 type II toxin-antitoxin system HicA family toxin [Gemmatimonadota bacterium]MBP6571917.1 type II toxin-antitoxin system HicA family toxin [Gemmatimonadales bacterium]